MTPLDAVRSCLRRSPRPGDAELMLFELRDRFGYLLVSEAELATALTAVGDPEGYQLNEPYAKPYAALLFAALVAAQEKGT